MVSSSCRLQISQKSHLGLQQAAGWQFPVLLCCSYTLSPAIVTNCQHHRSMHTIPSERVPRLSRLCEISPRIERGQLIELGRQRCKEHLFMMLRHCHKQAHAYAHAQSFTKLTLTRTHKLTVMVDIRDRLPIGHEIDSDPQTVGGNYRVSR